MSDVKHRPTSKIVNLDDWLVVQENGAGLGTEKRIQLANLNGGWVFDEKPGFILIGDSLQSLGNRSVTVTITATIGQSVANVKYTGHAVNAGQHAYITNVDQAEFEGIFKVSTVVDANNFTISLNSPATVSTATGNPVCTFQQRITDRSHVNLANFMAGCPAVYMGCLAAGGATTSEVLQRLDFALDPANNLYDRAADIVFCSVLTNDTLNDVSVANIQSNLEQIIKKIYQSGQILVLDSGWPISNTAGNWSEARMVNHLSIVHWLREKSITDKRFILLDTFAVCADLNNQYSNFKSGYSSDGIHQTKVGAYWVAKELKSLVFDKIQYNSDFRTLTNIVANHSLDGTAGTVSGVGGSGQSATSWTLQSLGGGSQTVVGSKGLSLTGTGKSQRAALTAVAALDRLSLGPSAQFSASVTAGQKYIFKARIRSANLTGAWRYLLMAFNATVNGYSGTFGASEANGTDGWPENFDMTLETPVWTVPAGLTSLNARIDCAFNGAGSGIFDISDVGVFKVE